MKANAVPLLELFQRKMRLEVPLFQRQYVWNREDQWEPLWEDVERKFNEYVSGTKDAPVHFLGAMVLDQKFTPTTHVERRQVIDGQQRLTTLQIFLAALRDFCRSQRCEDLAHELDGYTLNRGMMADPEVDRFKVWPTQLDRSQFTDVVGLGSRAEIEAKHPVVRKKYARKPEPRPQMVEAYVFFSNEIAAYFLGTGQEPPLAHDQPLPARIEEALQALKNALQVVVIDLEKDDDAQVIFETLNARGEPLLPADLLRNFIFLRAARQNESPEALYEKHWKGFDDEFWRKKVRQGRLERPRGDLFIQHFLSSRRFVDVPIKHLFVEYKYWIDRSRPFKTVADEVATLARQRDLFRRIVAPQPGDVVHDLAVFLDRFDIRTAYPLLLFFLDANLAADQWVRISRALESYLLRRAVLGWTTKAYNRIFLSLAKTLSQTGVTAAALEAALAGLSGESSAWPNDAEFAKAWVEANAYDLKNAKLTHILRRISHEHLPKGAERIRIEGPLTIEHLMPQRWIENWPLPGGKKGLTAEELLTTDDDDPRVRLTRARDSLLHNFGNLTIVTEELNPVLSNSSWAVKKPELMQRSLLPINQRLHKYAEWNEDTIEERSKALLETALRIWPRV